MAVVGATEKVGGVGRTVLLNLSKGPFSGKVFAVNPERKEVFGARAFPSIGEVPAEMDLAIIVTPATTVPGLIGECVDAGVKSVVVISAGFRERGAQGAELEQKIREQLQRGAAPCG